MNLSLDIRTSLSARARAGRQWPEIGFSDQFARLLAQLLGVSLKQKLPPLDERHIIQRSQWFDECCRDFFQRHPQAICIELGAGLSTRFHRLSDTADWPRFHWVEVDLPEVTTLKEKVLPPIDHFRLVSADIVRDDWLSASGWQEGQPLLVLLEAVAPELKANSLLGLIERLKKRTGSTELEIILDDTCPSFWQPKLFQLAARVGAKFRIPLTICSAELIQQGFKFTRQKSLLGDASVGMVINYQDSNYQGHQLQ